MSTICLYVYDMYNVYGSRTILYLYGFGQVDMVDMMFATWMV